MIRVSKLRLIKSPSIYMIISRVVGLCVDRDKYVPLGLSGCAVTSLSQRSVQCCSFSVELLSIYKTIISLKWVGLVGFVSQKIKFFKFWCAMISRESSKYQFIDEHMVKFKGKNSMKQYMKSKPIEWGFKLWCRCDSLIYTSSICTRGKVQHWAGGGRRTSADGISQELTMPGLCGYFFQQSNLTGNLVWEWYSTPWYSEGKL